MTTNFNFDSPIKIYSLNFDFGPVGFYYNYLLQGPKNLTSIWAEPDASLTSGMFYTASSGTLNIIKLNIEDTSELYDWYSQTHVGRANESLNGTNIVDINAT